MAEPIIVEQDFDATVDRLWSAITDRDEMVRWYFAQIEDFKAEVGHRTTFNVNTGERDFVHVWDVTEVVPKRRLSHTWTYADLEGEGAVTWELSGRDGGSKLRLICTGIETFPQDIPEFARESCEGGWQYFINQQLKNYLDA